MALKFFKWFFVFCLLFNVKAYGYDVDTHFYFTYLASRWVGINHETSVQIALGAQWVDESWASSPMEPTAYIGTAKRVLFHFPADIKAAPDGKIDIVRIRVFPEAEINNPLAWELIVNGLKSGSLLMTSAGFHVLEDSYSHAGYPASFGHVMDGHNPDRPFFYPQKYYEMIHKIFEALVIVRRALPQSALDYESDKPHASFDAETLSENFITNFNVKKVIENNIYTDPRFVKTCLKYFLEEGKNDGYLYPDADIEKYFLPESYDERKNIKDVLKETILKMLKSQSELGENVINDKLIKESLIPSIRKAYLDNNGKIPDALFPEVLDEAVSRIMANRIPMPFNDRHKTEFEIDPTIRKLEMDIRINDWRNLIFNLTGQNILFNPKLHSIRASISSLLKAGKPLTSWIKKWFFKPVTYSPEGHWDFNSIPEQPVGMKPTQRLRWNYMLYKYLLKHLILRKHVTPDPDTNLFRLLGEKGLNTWVANKIDTLFSDEKRYKLLGVRSISNMKLAKNHLLSLGGKCMNIFSKK